MISHNLNVILRTMPHCQLKGYSLKRTIQEGVDIETESFLNIFMTYYVFGHFTEKMVQSNDF